MTLLLGTCGWSYQEWTGLFYPDNRAAKLPFYGKVFDTVEVDSSFYKMPSKQMVKGWARSVGDSFKFSLKMPKTITHEKRLVGVKKDLELFLDVLDPIIPAKLGCLLAQLPPSFVFGPEEMHRLEEFFGLFPKLQFAVEFRHDSWNRQETWSLLKKYNVANTITDSPIEFLCRPIITATTHSFIRWHGRGNQIWYDYDYSSKELSDWHEKIKMVKTKVPIVYGYFNNHYKARAPTNALQFLQKTGKITEKQKQILQKIEKKFTPSKITDFI